MMTMTKTERYDEVVSPRISPVAMIRSLQPQTLKFKGLVKNTYVSVLVDSGSTATSLITISQRS
jgi:hypothetical protein